MTCEMAVCHDCGFHGEWGRTRATLIEPPFPACGSCSSEHVDHCDAVGECPWDGEEVDIAREYAEALETRI